MIRVRLFKEKEKGGEGRSKAWWPKERKGEGSFAWWPMEGEREGSMLGGQWKEKEKVLFHLFPLSPPSNFT
jgi:hypothetical protein